MSDYIPNPPNPERDPRTYGRYDEDHQSSKGLTLVVGILVAIALAAGVMFFAGGPSTGGRIDQAQVPATTQERQTLPPAAQPAPPTLPPTSPAQPRTSQ